MYITLHYMNLHLHSITFEDITCIHTYIHTSIHPSSIHTYIQCVRVCACVVFLISSMIAGWRTHPSIPTGADVRIESCATHWSTLKRGFLDWAPWPFYLFVIVHWYSDIFRYIQRFSCNLRTKVIASIKNYTMSYPKFISGKRWKRWWARGVWWFWYILMKPEADFLVWAIWCDAGLNSVHFALEVQPEHRGVTKDLRVPKG